MNTFAERMTTLDSVAAQGARSTGIAEGFMKVGYIFALLLNDLVMPLLAYRVAYWVRFGLKFTTAPEVVPLLEQYFRLSVVIAIGGLVFFAVAGLYSWHNLLGGTLEYARSFTICTISALLVIYGTFMFPTFVVSRVWLLTAWFFSVFFVLGGRFLLRRVVYALRTIGYFQVKALVIGESAASLQLAEELADRKSGYNVLGLVSLKASDAASAAHEAETKGLSVLGTLDELEELASRFGVKELVIPASSLHRDELFALYSRVQAVNGLEMRISTELFELLTTGVQVRTAGAVPLIGLRKMQLDTMELVIKTALEYFLAILGLILVAPVFVMISVALKFDSPGPIIYRRRVIGVGGKEFDAYKFRTMHVDGDRILERDLDASAQLRANAKLKQDPRVTRVGLWLRKFSLDELPQLFNVLRGEMSLVGPRMITAPEAERYGRNRFNLLTVKPGMTGLWQVSGRSDLSYADRVRLDMYYIRNYSLWMDLRILFIKTASAVLQGRGAY